MSKVPHPNRLTVHLRQLIRHDRASTDLPIPLGGGRWAWLRQPVHRVMFDRKALALLARVDVVIAIDEHGQQQDIVSGRDVLERIRASGRTESVHTLAVMLDGTARRLFSECIDHGTDDVNADLDLLTALVEVAKGSGRTTMPTRKTPKSPADDTPTPKTMTKTSFVLDSDLLMRLKLHAVARRMEMSAIVRTLIEDYLQGAGHATEERTEIMKATERIALGKGQGSLFKRAGSNNWYLYLSVRGKDVIESTGTADEKEARKVHALRVKERGADDLGLQPFTGPALKRLRVRDFLAALEAYFERERKKCWPKARSHMVPLYRHFGDWRAIALTEQAIDRYVAARRTLGRTDTTINRELQILGQAIRLKVQNVRLPHVPTMRRLPGERHNARQGFFEPHEFHPVANALPEILADFSRYARLTAWRKGESKTLKWPSVNRAARLITLRAADAKTGKGRSVPIEGDLVALIERRWQARVFTRSDGTTGVSEYVFHHQGKPIGDFRKAWKTACRAAGISGKLFHDLRRTAIRDMVNSGVREKVAMEISGHRTRSVFDRYHIVNEDDKREALKRRDAHVAGMAEAPSTRTVAVLPTPARRSKEARQSA